MSFRELVTNIITTIFDPLVGLLFAIALASFFWGLVKYISAESGSGKGEGRSLMLWGVVALFVMVSVWGLVRLMQDTVPGLRTNNLQKIPDRTGVTPL